MVVIRFKELLKDYILPVVGGIGVIVDVALRVFSPDSLDFLFKPFIAINLVEAIVFLVLALWCYRLIPSVYRKIKDRKRAEYFLKTWKEFKKLLLRHYIQGEAAGNLQEEYAKVRECLETDFNYFLDEITRLQRSNHRSYPDLVLRNFEACFRPRRIEVWGVEVGRRVPEEVDGFDYILVGLAESFKK